VEEPPRRERQRHDDENGNHEEGERQAGNDRERSARDPLAVREMRLARREASSVT
jgi:hypothetical protein